MGVYLHWEPALLTRLLALPPAERARLAAALRHTTAGLDELAERPVAAADVSAAFEAALFAQLGVRLAPGDWLPAEREAADRLRREQFQPLREAS
jgi:hypothetical protein